MSFMHDASLRGLRARGVDLNKRPLQCCFFHPIALFNQKPVSLSGILSTTLRAEKEATSGRDGVVP